MSLFLRLAELTTNKHRYSGNKSISFSSFMRSCRTLFLQVSISKFQLQRVTCFTAQFHWLISKSARARFSCRPHTLRRLPQKVKNIKYVRYFYHGLARQNSHTILTAHLRKQLSKRPREAESSAVSQSVRWPFNPLISVYVYYLLTKPYLVNCEHDLQSPCRPTVRAAIGILLLDSVPSGQGK